MNLIVDGIRVQPNTDESLRSIANLYRFLRRTG